MTEKNIKSRIVHKHDIEAHWNLATNFVPLQGEIIIYDIDENYDYERFKIGDGKTNVNELPFANDGLATEEYADAIVAKLKDNSVPCIIFGVNFSTVYVSDLMDTITNTGFTTTNPIVINFKGMVSGVYFCRFNRYTDTLYGCEFTDLKNLNTYFRSGDVTSMSLYETLSDISTCGLYRVNSISDLSDRVAELEENGAGAGIIDVTELPTENINEDVFYRLLTGTFVYNQFTQNDFTCYCVETLPEVGEPATTDMTTITAYYNVSDGICYGYVDGALSSAMGVPVGWYDGSVLLPAAGYAYGGVVTSLDEATLEETFYLMLQYVIYSYKDGWTVFKSIGKSGTGVSAEVFNHPSNVASGSASHAEGYNTMASGDYSHSEGAGTTASNSYSHAEGVGTEASGHTSHAEGYYTIASGDRSHVQGKYNVEDTEGAYAHIVGNGENSSSRSNAHTLDWSGNAWFQGNVYVGGTGQDDTATTKLITEAELENKGYLTEHQTIKTINGETLIGEGDITTSAIIDVTEPLVGVFNTQVLYRTSNAGKVVKAEIATAGRLAPELGDIEIVDALPDVGMPAIDLINGKYYIYYLASENEIYGYITELLASNLGAFTGWYKPGDLGMTVTIVDSADKAVTEDLYVVITRQPQLFHYANNSFERIATESDLADCKAIVEVDDFSKHNANAYTLYRSKGDVTSIEFVRNNEILSNFTCNIVDALPEIGEQFFSFDTNQVSLVYQKQDCQIYGYIVEEVATEDMEAGWYEATILMLALDELSGVGQYGGVISSLDQAIDSTKIYALTARGDGKPTLHYYRELDNGFAKGEIGAGYSEIVSIKEETIEEIYPETTLNIVTNLDSDRMALLSGEELLVKDVSYRVTFDGVVYNLICRAGFFSEDMTEPILMMGNANIFGYQPSMDTGEPFVVFTKTDIGTVLCTATTGNHTISVSKVEVTAREEEIVHKIDPKYYDAGSGGGSPMTSITYAELKALRDSGSLVAGMFYRITDYQCTTVQENTGAMANQFDIIVQALNESTLSETASADLHEGDTYFADSNLGAWEIKYCLDNDTTRFAWADETNGKGVIYYMKDEFGNECPYDFKNITYKGSEIYGAYEALPDQEAYYPTFITAKGYTYTQWGSTVTVTRNSSLDTEKDGVTYYGYTCSDTPPAWSSTDFYITDAELIPSSTMYEIIDGVSSEISYGGTLLVAYSRDNIIKPYLIAGSHTLPCIVFVSISNSNIVGNNCYNITFYGNCIRNTVGEECYNLSFNSASNTTVPCGTLYYHYEGNANEAFDPPEYFPKVTYEAYYGTTIEIIASILERRGWLNTTFLFSNDNGVCNGSYIGYIKLNATGTYDFEFRKLLGYDIYSGAGVSGSLTWGDIMLNNAEEYYSNPIEALEARIAALEDKTIPTEDDLKSYIDETILGGAW